VSDPAARQAILDLRRDPEGLGVADQGQRAAHPEQMGGVEIGLVRLASERRREDLARGDEAGRPVPRARLVRRRHHGPGLGRLHRERREQVFEGRPGLLGTLADRVDHRVARPGAAGPRGFQFIEQTWLGVMKQDGPSLGLGSYADAITARGSGAPSRWAA
jgi:hypothetical protein